MCELLALSFSRPIHAGVAIQEFALRSEENADGWDLAWYPDRSLSVFKEPVKWRASRLTNFLETYEAVRAPVILAHVRHWTTGPEPCHADSHPFSRELSGREYCLAHNGTLEGDFWKLPLGRY